ncbi:hypothetical protein GCM10025867_31170 [Frondihabitans sucicola]|uniref:Uncharacterized protein n=1 Tax=Frondihabitans sucicola TaxID=1268041 RepID=A0ABN6Y129_9MICO|nr:hypothetical protein GCM10025867_31170 [Frondihabitans sucicola]
MTGVEHAVAETRPDLAVEVLNVAEPPGDRDRAPGGARRIDGEVGSLLRNETAEPDEPVASRALGPTLAVDGVRQHRRLDPGLPPHGLRVSAHREEAARAGARGIVRLDEVLDDGGVERGDHRNAEIGCPGQREAVQAVVEDHVDAAGPGRHPVEGGAKGRQGDVQIAGRIRVVGGRRIVTPLDRGQDERGLAVVAALQEIGAGRSDEGHPVASPSQEADLVPDRRFETSGERLPDRESQRRDHDD